jgi:plasmid stability protein
MTSPATASTSSTNDVALVVRLPHDLREALKERAAAEDRSVASLLRVAARTYLDSEAGE